MSWTCLLLLPLILGQAPETPTTFIDRFFHKHWQEEKIVPSASASDHAFLRRASLDLIGRIPMVTERESFFKDPPQKRRALLIDRLLQNEGFARHWANVWTDCLLGSVDDLQARKALHEWLQQHFAANGSHQEMVVKLLTAKGSTRDNPAVQWILSLRGQAFPEKDWAFHGQFDMAPLTNLASRLFLGRRLQCVACHDHPFDSDFGQHHFAGLNGFFRQAAFREKQVGKERHFELAEDLKLNSRGIVPYIRMSGVLLYTEPTFIDGSKWHARLKQTRREFFAEHLVKHPDFGRSYVQHIWSTLFNHSLSQGPDADDTGEHNPVMHAQVLDRLAKDFAVRGQDPKALLRWLCTSEVYGLDSAPNKTNVGQDKAGHFATFQIRPLTPDQLVESLSVVLHPSLGQDQRANLRQVWLRKLGRSPQPDVSHCEVQKLGPPDSSRSMVWLMTSDSVERALAHKDSLVANALRRKTIELGLEEMFLEALSRPASPREKQALLGPDAPELRRGKMDLANEAVRREYFEDILWSLLNSVEFATNH